MRIRLRVLLLGGAGGLVLCAAGGASAFAAGPDTTHAPIRPSTAAAPVQQPATSQTGPVVAVHTTRPSGPAPAPRTRPVAMYHPAPSKPEDRATAPANTPARTRHADPGLPGVRPASPRPASPQLVPPQLVQPVHPDPPLQHPAPRKAADLMPTGTPVLEQARPLAARPGDRHLASVEIHPARTAGPGCPGLPHATTRRSTAGAALPAPAVPHARAPSPPAAPATTPDPAPPPSPDSQARYLQKALPLVQGPRPGDPGAPVPRDDLTVLLGACLSLLVVLVGLELFRSIIYLRRRRE